MRPPRDELREVDWPSVFPWLLLVRSLQGTLRGRVLALAWIASALVAAGVWGGDVWMGEPPADAAPTVADAPLPLRLFSDSASHLAVAWWGFVEPFWRVVDGAATLSGVLVGLWRVVVWTLFGLAIARVTALWLTRFETPDPVGAFRYAVARWPSAAAAPVMCLLGVLFIATPVLLAGLAARLDWLAPVLAVGWPLLLVWSLLVGVMAIGLALGWPLMTASLAVENADAFDAVSCAYGYVYQRPLRLLGYVAFALALGVLGGVLIELLALAPAWTSRLMAFAGEADRAPLAGHFSARFVRFWTDAYLLLVRSYYHAYLFTAATGIYLLLRRDIDGRQLDEVSFEEEPVDGLIAEQAAAIGESPSATAGDEA